MHSFTSALFCSRNTLNSKGGIFTGFGVHVFCGPAHSGYHHVYGHVLLLYVLLHQRSWEWLWRYRRTNHWGKERRHSIETFQSSQTQVISSWSKYWDKAICQRLWKNGISDVWSDARRISVIIIFLSTYLSRSLQL